MVRLAGNEVRSAHRGELRALVAAPGGGLGQLRAYLAADLLRRMAERSALAPSVVDLLPDGADELRADCGALNIHPPRHTLTPPVQLGGLFPDGVREPVFDVGVRLAGEPGAAAGEQGAAAAEGLAATWIEVAGGAAGGATGTLASLPREGAGGEEPLSVRLLLLRHGYGEPVGGADPAAAAADAARTLARWRKRVAEWARSPSGAMSRRYADAITAAFADDLDTAAALRELAALEADPDEPDGVKFETFAAADRLFGLDLARDIGK